jgi:hypothetical protein
MLRDMHVSIHALHSGEKQLRSSLHDQLEVKVDPKQQYLKMVGVHSQGKFLASNGRFRLVASEAVAHRRDARDLKT